MADYTAWVDTDWPDVNPVFVSQELGVIELHVIDVDTSMGLSDLLDLLPDSLFDELAWTDLRDDLVYSQVQGNPSQAEFAYISFADLDLLTTWADYFDRGLGSDWTNLGTDTSSSGGFTIDVDTEELDAGWYITRVYLTGSSPAGSRYGFGVLNIVRPE